MASSTHNPAFIIGRKRDGHDLTDEEIKAFITGYAAGEVPDYQMSALAMAIYLRGMQPAETAALTQAMLDSGITLTWPDGARPRVDKHSTGGVGDKVSLVLAPLLACCDLQVPMISGRGLGATGGTLDKLEAIAHFRTDLSIEEIQRITDQVGCVITGASAEIAPADKRLYALRDVTGTVASIPLITASIMSKKLAAGLDALVLDVKFGNGAFMQTLQDAQRLARSLVDTGQRMGVKTTALLTDMNQPLGRMIGNAVEVAESIRALEGQGPADLLEITLDLAAELLKLSGRASCNEDALRTLNQQYSTGRALEKFREMIAAQGGDPDAKLSIAPTSLCNSPRAGYVRHIDTAGLGRAIILLGGGRRQISDTIDHSVGLEMLVRLGDPVDQDQPLIKIFASPEQAAAIQSTLQQCITIGDPPETTNPLIVQRISAASGA